MLLVFFILQIVVDFLFAALFINHIHLFNDLHDMILDIRNESLESSEETDE